MLVVGRGKNHHGALRRLEFRQHAKPVALGHLDVQEHQVRALCPDGLHGRLAVAAGADDLDVRIGLKEELQSLPGEGLVIHDERADFLHTAGLHKGIRRHGRSSNTRMPPSGRGVSSRR